MLEFALAAAAAILARLLGWLTNSGAVAAALVGGAIFHFGGPSWAAALLAFFVSGSALTMVGRRQKTQPEHRGRGRSSAQVVGTAGVSAIASVLWGTGVLPEEIHALLPAAFLGALATSAADTWATELGMLSRRPPRLFTTGAYVPAGTSGGVTLVGSLAGIAGAILVSAIGAQGQPRVFTAAWVAGALAMFIDSLLGATVQASFRRPDGTVTEEPTGGAVLTRGTPWLTNPMVNFLATMAGAVIAGVLAAWW